MVMVSGKCDLAHNVAWMLERHQNDVVRSRKFFGRLVTAGLMLQFVIICFSYNLLQHDVKYFCIIHAYGAL